MTKGHIGLKQAKRIGWRHQRSAAAVAGQHHRSGAQIVLPEPMPHAHALDAYSDITERKRSEAELRASRDAAEQASRIIEAAYRDLRAAQANLIQAEQMASWASSPLASRTKSRTR